MRFTGGVSAHVADRPRSRRSKLPRATLVPRLRERGAEERRDESARDRGQLAHEGRKVDRRHAARPSLIGWSFDLAKTGRARQLLLGLSACGRRAYVASCRPVLGRFLRRVHEHPKRSADGGRGRRRCARRHVHLGLHRPASSCAIRSAVIAPNLALELGLFGRVGLLSSVFFFLFCSPSRSARRRGSRSFRPPGFISWSQARRSRRSAPLCSPLPKIRASTILQDAPCSGLGPRAFRPVGISCRLRSGDSAATSVCCHAFTGLQDQGFGTLGALLAHDRSAQPFPP